MHLERKGTRKGARKLCFFVFRLCGNLLARSPFITEKKNESSDDASLVQLIEELYGGMAMAELTFENAPLFDLRAYYRANLQPKDVESRVPFCHSLFMEEAVWSVRKAFTAWILQCNPRCRRTLNCVSLCLSLFFPSQAKERINSRFTERSCSLNTRELLFRLLLLCIQSMNTTRAICLLPSADTLNFSHSRGNFLSLSLHFFFPFWHVKADFSSSSRFLFCLNT